jgi:hypothetical protein
MPVLFFLHLADGVERLLAVFSLQWIRETLKTKVHALDLVLELIYQQEFARAQLLGNLERSSS